jgi:tellurite resistance protein TerC
VELSLSVDKLFVFVIIIGSFSVPVAQQPKTLTIGIVLALGLRAVFIAVGAALLQAFSFMFLIFGIALTMTARTNRTGSCAARASPHFTYQQLYGCKDW